MKVAKYVMISSDYEPVLSSTDLCIQLFSKLILFLNILTLAQPHRSQEEFTFLLDSDTSAFAPRRDSHGWYLVRRNLRDGDKHGALKEWRFPWSSGLPPLEPVQIVPAQLSSTYRAPRRDFIYVNGLQYHPISIILFQSSSYTMVYHLPAFPCFVIITIL